MSFAHPGGKTPGSTVTGGVEAHPAKAVAGERLPSNDGTYVRYGHPQKGAPDRGNAAAEALQRLREGLEMAAIAAGSRHPEQLAAALLSKGVGL